MIFGMSDKEAKRGHSAKVSDNANADNVWPGGNTYCGMSLKAPEIPGKQKGHTVVGYAPGSANAFFVRNNLLNHDFFGPFTAETLYQPYRRCFSKMKRTFSYAPCDRG